MIDEKPENCSLFGVEFSTPEESQTPMQELAEALDLEPLDLRCINCDGIHHGVKCPMPWKMDWDDYDDNNIVGL